MLSMRTKTESDLFKKHKQPPPSSTTTSATGGIVTTRMHCDYFDTGRILTAMDGGLPFKSR